MKVGVLQFFGWPARKAPIEKVYANALERIGIMDRTGFDAVWLAEHHFNSFSVCPSVTMMGLQVAERTERLRIGTAGTLAGLHNPLHLAEQLAFLDVLSGGRLNWGAARGFDATEFRAFGVAGDESAAIFREHVLAILAAWSQEKASFHGDYVSFDDIELLPKPAQQPRPPTWMAAGSEPAMHWAASQGLPILLGPHASHAETANHRLLWDQAMTENGHDPAGHDIPIARLLAIAGTDAEAEAIARRGAGWMIGSYINDNRGNVVTNRPKDPSAPADPVDRYIDRVIVWGTPDKVIDELEALREQIPLQYLMAAPLSGETFHLFTDKVLPTIGRS